MRKFRLGNLVRFTSRVPIWVSQEKRRKTYRITGIFYDSSTQSTRYYIGQFNYPFRSYMLRFATIEEALGMGRPKTKRVYRKHRGRRKKARI